MKTRRMRFSRRRAGFSLIELLIVIIIAGALMGIAIPQLNRIRGQRAARNARDVLAWTAQRARARAIQTGQTQLFQIDPANHRAWIVPKGTTDTVLTIDFPGQYEATLSATSNAVISTALITVCYGPRGYAYNWGTDCRVTGSTNTAITFTHAGNANFVSTARLKPMGQVERL